MRALRAYCFFGLLMLFVTSAEAVDADDGSADAALTEEVTALDSSLFDAYNRCDLRTFGSYLDDRVELYHDRNGAAFGRADVVDAIADAACGTMRRELVAGSLEVYPIHDYGAVEAGLNRFYKTSAGEARPVSEARFLIIWHFNDGTWKATRVITYDHQALQQ
jgi:hypothetical protein